MVAIHSNYFEYTPSFVYNPFLLINVDTVKRLTLSVLKENMILENNFGVCVLDDENLQNNLKFLKDKVLTYSLTSDLTDFAVRQNNLTFINTIDSCVSLANILEDFINVKKDKRPIFVKSANNCSKNVEFKNELAENLMWTHICSGGVGAGILEYTNTDNLESLLEFSKLVPWSKFPRNNISNLISFDNKHSVHAFACASSTKALVYLLRKDSLDTNGVYKVKSSPVNVKLAIPFDSPGTYKIYSWKASTKESSLVLHPAEKSKNNFALNFSALVKRNLILYIEKV